MFPHGLIAAALISLFAHIAAAQSRPSSLFDVGKDKAQRAVITLGEMMPDLESGAPPMLAALTGVLADLKAAKLDQLRACLPPSPMRGDAGGAEPVCTIHLFAKPGTPEHRVNIVRAKDGNFIAIDASGTPPQRAELKRDGFAALTGDWPSYRGPFDPAEVKDPLEKVIPLAPPFIPGRFTIDKKTISERFNGGSATSLEAADRVLANEKFSIRLPRDYSPKSPAGLLVWVNAMNSGSPPQVFWPALDELNIICIGADDSGNNRHISNREQLALDAVASASRRYHIDPRRVYVTGISGGGRVSSMLTACFPDVFTGAVPIVGLACYENVPTGTGQFYRAGFARPRPDMFNLFKTRRLAPITGRKDFNELEVQQAAALMKLDGIQVKVFEETKMGHEMPPPAKFTEALKWIDEQYQTARDAESEAAKKALDTYTTKYSAAPPKDELARRALYKVIEAGPWTEAAWKAIDLLALPQLKQVQTPQQPTTPTR